MHDAVVILASSRKLGGICLAGKALAPAGPRWVRPLASVSDRSWSLPLLRYRAGGVPMPGSRLMMPLGPAVPAGHQQENCLVQASAWQVAKPMAVDEILPLVDVDMDLWRNGHHTVHGWNDRVPEYWAESSIRSSLRLIRPSWLRFELSHYAGHFVVRAAFEWAGAEYRLRVTDDVAAARWQACLMSGARGDCDAMLTISLGLPYDGYCYKLVAGVMELN